MANIYDQFDEPAAAPPGGQANVYDQFDVGAPTRLIESPGQQISRGLSAAFGGQVPQVAGGLSDVPSATAEFPAVSPEPQPQAPTPTSISDRLSAVGDILQGVRRSIIRTEDGGQVRLFGMKPSAVGTAQGLYEVGKSAVTAPHQAYTGELDPLSEEGIRRAWDIAMLATPGAPRVGLPAAARVAAPTVEELYGAAGYKGATGPGGEPLNITARPVGYQAPEVVGAPLQPPQAAADLVNQVRFDLAQARASDVLAPKTFKLIQRAEKPPEGAAGLSLENVETLRQQLGDISPIKDASGGVTNAADLKAAAIARDRIDQYIRDTFPEAAPTLEAARGNVAAAKSAEVFDRGEFKAELRKARTGTPVSETMQAQMERILTNPAERRGYSRPELLQMQKIIEGGGLLERGARAVERFAREEKFISPVTRPLVAFPLGKLAEYLAGREVTKLNEMIRADSPLGRQIQGPLEDWSRAAAAQEATPNARNFSRLGIASRNLSNNLKDAGIVLSPRRLIGPPRSMSEQEQ